jgi:hypothetical protein
METDSVSAAANLSTSFPVGTFDMPIWVLLVVAGVFAYAGVAILAINRGEPPEKPQMITLPRVWQSCFVVAVLALFLFGYALLSR